MTTYAGRAVWPQPFMDQRGNARAGLVVTVYEAGTLTPATLYTDRTKATELPSNSTSTDAAGNLWLFADPGDYDAFIDGEAVPFSVATDDADVVHASGAETVAGKKTLSTAPEVTQSGAARVTRETRTPRQFGAPMNGIDPDTAGFRAALDAMGDLNSLRPAELVIDGPLMLDDTVIIRRKSGRITSPGWGSSFNDLTNSKAYIGWLGSAGIEMIRIYECWGLELEGLRLVGNSDAKPSAAIRCFMGAGNSNQMLTMRRLWVGPLWGYDIDHERQFSTGLLWDGANANNDFMRLDTICTHMCDTGFKFVGTQMGESELQHLLASYCDTGLESASTLTIHGFHCLGNSDYDLRLTGDSRMSIDNYSSEGSAAFADLTSTPSTLVVDGGNFQAGENMREDGRIINGQTPYFTNVELRSFYLADTTTVDQATPTIRLRGGSEKALLLKNTKGIGEENIDMQADSGGEKRILMVEQTPSGGATQRFVVNNFNQGDIDFDRFDFAEQDIAQRRANGVNRFESWRQTAEVDDEIGRWDFVGRSTRQNVARIAAFVAPDWTDAGELAFYTKWSGDPLAQRLRLLRTGGLFINNTTLNPSSSPAGGGTLYVDKDDGALKYRGPSGTVTTVAPA